MQYTQLGKAGLQVSRLCLGTMNFGPTTPEADAHKIMDRALDAGINFFDTANGYGSEIRHGLTEEIIGNWFALGGVRRERVVIATKVFCPMDRNWAPNKSGLSARHIREQVDASLRRLKVDYIDLYQMHHISRGTPAEEALQTFEILVRQGKVLYIGSSNFAGWHITQYAEQAAKRNFVGLVSEQSHYNLVQRSVEAEVLPACRFYKVGMICWSPLGGGLLGGVLKQISEGRRSREWLQKKVAELRPKLEAYEKLCAEIGAEPANVALAWLLSRPGVVGPIIGPRTLEQLEAALPAAELTLSDETLKKLDEIWPSPSGGKEGPEAWAW
ncbi:MAG: aldo/keto reductase [Phycisphaeraceae bacterium]|nr:aldo/keto reductase [Phycisphaeraceae bacterium]